uniref:Amidinotransferase n=1 Tax=Ditylenchus dipsaci TaxID=166011 RepID=A0A915DQN8_9BILA
MKQGAIAVSDVIQRVLMVAPKHFTVEYSINPWMGGTVDSSSAMKQWQQLKQTIEKEDVKVSTLEQAKGLPDMVFSCNSGLVLGNKVYLSKFRHKERTGEQHHFAKWFKENGFQALGQDYPEVFEGGGDAFFSDYKTLWAGYGPRTSKQAYSEVSQLGDFDTVLCELTDPRFYHLDTCFCPVGAKSALWFPAAFSAQTQKEILNRLPNAIAVSEEEAKNFVCNAITIRNTVISPIGVSEATRQALKHLGYSVAEVDMSEFMKSGGACQCLVLKL